jgi:hypothetical protein
MVDHIKQILENEKESKTYRRINSSHPLSIYIGYNSKEYPSMVLTEYSADLSVASTKIIEVNTYRRTDGKLALEFALTDKLFSTMFYKFCEDVITSSNNISKDKAIIFFVNRWEAWRLMFQNANKDILSDKVIEGLLGELIFIEKSMIPKYGLHKSISAWEGPMGKPKDFIINQTWYEVKTISTAAKSIVISSLEQLDADNEGFLEVMKVERTNRENSNAVNLNIQIEKIKNVMTDINDLKEFMRKLSLVGYCIDETYSKQYFEFKTSKEFAVKDGFPRIRRKDIPKEILKLQYEISLADL